MVEPLERSSIFICQAVHTHSLFNVVHVLHRSIRASGRHWKWLLWNNSQSSTKIGWSRAFQCHHYVCRHSHMFYQTFARKELNFDRMSERDRKQIVAEVYVKTLLP